MPLTHHRACCTAYGGQRRTSPPPATSLLPGEACACYSRTCLVAGMRTARMWLVVDASPLRCGARKGARAAQAQMRSACVRVCHEGVGPSCASLGSSVTAVCPPLAPRGLPAAGCVAWSGRGRRLGACSLTRHQERRRAECQLPPAARRGQCGRVCATTNVFAPSAAAPVTTASGTGTTAVRQHEGDSLKVLTRRWQGIQLLLNWQRVMPGLAGLQAASVCDRYNLRLADSRGSLR